MKTFGTQPLIVAVALLLAGAPVRAADSAAPPPTRSVTQPAANDDWINFKVQIALMFHNGASGNAGVSVENGIVTLRGTATSQAQKDLTGLLARNVRGVTDVINEMTIGTSTAATSRDMTEMATDEALTLKAKTALLNNQSTRPLPVEIHTARGVVTVTGFAHNAAEKQLVTVLLQRLQGAKAVHNDMIITE